MWLASHQSGRSLVTSLATTSETDASSRYTLGSSLAWRKQSTGNAVCRPTDKLSPGFTQAGTGGRLELASTRARCWIWAGSSRKPNLPALMARRWSGQRDQAAIESLQPVIARCNRKQIKVGYIGRVKSSTARHAGEGPQPPTPPRVTLPTILGGRANVHIRLGSSPWRGPRISSGY